MRTTHPLNEPVSFGNRLIPDRSQLQHLFRSCEFQRLFHGTHRIIFGSVYSKLLIRVFLFQVPGIRGVGRVFPPLSILAKLCIKRLFSKQPIGFFNKG